MASTSTQWLDANDRIVCSDSTLILGKELKVTQIKNGAVVATKSGLHYADDATITERHASGAIRSYSIKKADGSLVELDFAEPSSSKTFGDSRQLLGELQATFFQSALSIPGKTPFRVEESFAHGHRTSYKATPLDGSTDLSLKASYDEHDKTTRLVLDTLKGAFNTKVAGQIDAIGQLLDPAKLFAGKGSDLKVGEDGFEIKAADGTGLKGANGTNWTATSAHFTDSGPVPVPSALVKSAGLLDLSNPAG